MDEQDPTQRIREEYTEKGWGDLVTARKIRDDRARILKNCGFTVKVGTTETFGSPEDGAEDPQRAAILEAVKHPE